MARRPEDPRVTDLARYRKAREQQKRQPPPRPAKNPRRPASSERFLGSNPRAGMILAVVILLAVALFVLPALL